MLVKIFKNRRQKHVMTINCKAIMNMQRRQLVVVVDNGLLLFGS